LPQRLLAKGLELRHDAGCSNLERLCFANASAARGAGAVVRSRHPDPRPEASTLDTVLVNAIAQIGKPYRWGGESPQTGFDCSGLIQYVVTQAGVPVPRSSYAQAAALPAVSPKRIRPGDLVFFNTTGQPFSHVGIYIGGEQFVSALNPRQGVAVQSLRIPYWADRLDGVRRPFSPELLAANDR